MPSLLSDLVLDALIQKAFEARLYAYAPYSRFAVGAAVLAKSGKMHWGCNVENGSYGLSICAERTAVFKAVSEGEKGFDAIAIVADSERPVSPCGACRQVLAEFQSDMIVVMSNSRFEKKIIKLSELLPEMFQKRQE